MLVKTSDLIGPALDWAVATADGEDVIVHGVGQYRYDKRGGIHCCKYGCTFGPRSITHDVPGYSPSEDWSQGGPLIEKYDVELWRHSGGHVVATIHGGKQLYSNGETRLIAACRAIVAAKLGDQVDVPDELMQS
jgi:hypothetical protein